MQLMTHVLHCPWFRESKIYRLYGCEQLHRLGPLITPDNSSLPFQKEGPAASSHTPESLPRDRSSIDQSNQRKQRKQLARLDEEVWVEHKDEIHRLYIDQGRPLREVMAEMKKRGLVAREKQYKHRLGRWGFRKRELIREEQQTQTIPPVKRKSVPSGTTPDGNQALTQLSARTPYSSHTRLLFSPIRSDIKASPSDGIPDLDALFAPTSPSVSTDDMSYTSPEPSET